MRPLPDSAGARILSRTRPLQESFPANGCGKGFPPKSGARTDSRTSGCGKGFPPKSGARTDSRTSGERILAPADSPMQDREPEVIQAVKGCPVHVIKLQCHPKKTREKNLRANTTRTEPAPAF